MQMEKLQEINDEEVRRSRRIDKIKKLIEPIMGSRFEAVLSDFEECYIWNMYLTRTPPAKRYLQDKDLRMYVDQHHGCCEDGGFGTIWYHLKGRHWVALEFNC